MTLMENAVLTGLEYVALMFAVCGICGHWFMRYLKPLLAYGVFYVIAVITRGYISEFVLSIILFVTVIFFIKIIFNEKLSRAILTVAFVMVVFLSLLQVFAITALGMLLSGPLEYRFTNGLIVMGFVVAFSVFSYFYLPMRRLQKIMTKKFLVVLVTAHIAAIGIIWFALSTVYYEVLIEHRDIFVNYFSYYVATLLSVVCYATYKLAREHLLRNAATQKINELENLSTGKDFTRSKHVWYPENCYHLSLVPDSDEKADWYIKTLLNNFEDHEVGYQSKSRLGKLKSKALAASLYETVLYLRGMGYNCRLDICNYSLCPNDQVSDLIKAISILVDEIAQTSVKERSDIRIILDKDDHCRPFVRMFNRNDLSGTETHRITEEEYSLKTKKAFGLRRLHVISCKNDWRLKVLDRWPDSDGMCIRLTYVL